MRSAAVVALLLVLGQPALADDAGFVLVGPDGNELRVSPEDLADLPSRKEHIAFEGAHGEEAADYQGVALWDLLWSGVLTPGPAKDRVRLVARVTGHDGFVAAVAIAEIDPTFEGKDVLLGHALDASGAPAGPLRMVVPGDKHGARAVKDVARIEIR